MLGGDQPLILHLLDIPAMQPALKGIDMELQDCAFPLVLGLYFVVVLLVLSLSDVVCTTDLKTAFSNVDVALLVGSRPRTAVHYDRKCL